MKRTLPTVLLSLFSVFLLSACEREDKSAGLRDYPARGTCTLDGPAKNATVNSQEEFTFRGWAFDSRDRSVPDSVIAYFINEETLELVTRSTSRIARPDVAAAFKYDGVTNSGFTTLVPPKTLAPGKYRIELLQIDNQNGGIRCGSFSHKITVE